MNIINIFMNNVIILILAVRICEDSDKRGSDKRGYTVLRFTFERSFRGFGRIHTSYKQL